MALLKILHFPDPRLRKVAEPITTVDAAVTQQADDMLETMYDANGIGLAGTQVNYHHRILVLDLSEARNEPMVFINPQITPVDGEQEYDEGCLSVPGFYETITRHDKIKVNALDKHGEPFEIEADGLLSVCIQHEVDHLDGKLFVDYLSNLKRTRIKQKLQKQSKKLKA